MYRYYERETVNGKTYPTSGVTRVSERAMDKHLHKIGRPQYIRGYLYRRRTDGLIVTGVEVRGSEGSIRFGGFAWGYWGTGPAGLQALFDRLGVPLRAGSIGGEHPNWTPENVREHWRYTFTENGSRYVETRSPQVANQESRI